MSEKNITVLKDVRYGEHERNVIDIYIPEDPVSKTGFILIIHGGGWTSGDKSIHTPDTEYWSRLGYICGTMNYRYVCESVNVFDELDDVDAALKKAKEVCAQYGADIKKLLLSGGSAGAHLSLMYAYTRYSSSPLAPVAAFCCCPPTDCSTPDFLMGISGEFESWKYEVLSYCCAEKITKETLNTKAVQAALKRISPISYISDACVPCAVCHGKSDELVPYCHTLVFLDMLKKHNIRTDLITFQNSGHALDKDPDALIESKKLMQIYLEEYFETQQSVD